MSGVELAACDDTCNFQEYRCNNASQIAELGQELELLTGSGKMTPDQKLRAFNLCYSCRLVKSCTLLVDSLGEIDTPALPTVA